MDWIVLLDLIWVCDCVVVIGVVKVIVLIVDVWWCEMDFGDWDGLLLV